MARIAFTSLPGEEATDPRDLPLYSLAEVAYFLKVPKQTIHAWSRPTKFKGKVVRALITPADQHGALYSFYNLAEGHILSMTTRFHGVKTLNVRKAMESLREVSGVDSAHPLLSEEFLTDGRHIWLRQLERRIDLSQHGQLGISAILDTYLERLERDEAFRPKKIYPMRQTGKIVSIAPTVSSGRPMVDGTGIPVSSLWNRYRAGDSAQLLAEDYEITEDQVRGAIGYLEQLSSAA